VMYNDLWFQEYLRKDPNRVVLENVWEQPEVIGKYYPSKEKQEACKVIGEASKSRDANRDMCEAFQQFVAEGGVKVNDVLTASEWLNRWHMDRCLLIDKRLFKQKLDLIVRLTWNKWRNQDWQVQVAKEYGCYQGGGDTRLREFGCTVFKDDPSVFEDHANSEILPQPQQPLLRNESSRSETSPDCSTVHDAQQDEQESSQHDEEETADKCIQPPGEECSDVDE